MQKEEQDELLEEMKEAANAISEIVKKHGAYLTYTEGIIFIEKQDGSSVRSVGLEDIQL